MNATLDRVPILILNPHSRCNCRCVMCDIWKTDRAAEISVEDLDQHLDDMARLHVEWVVFSGGEPLMHSDLFRLADRLRSRDIRTTLLSTGLLLERFAEQTVRSIDDVIVSLDGPAPVHDAIRRVPGAFERLSKGIRALRERAPGYQVSARSTVQRANCTSLRKTVAAARELGLDSISFLAADLTSTAFNRPGGWPAERQQAIAPAAGELDALEFEIEALIETESGRGFVVETPEKLRRILKHFRAHHQLEEEQAPRCNAPWVSAVIEADGSVRPCFFHDVIGNLREASLTEVLNGPRAQEFRANLRVSEDPVCRRCVCSLYRA
jgi:MoaA/NifB/PqqE/SkfB family radical SAM enzyme